ncbi:acetolactate synthase catalytic subunit [Tropicibacter sp. Alg240-R139]|uniref:acetolactate synthase catalytic subunit n=1 Tax=Tropicibacter sp. Alg240-R139 TaxID=2305991 RepID=UPI0013DF7C45|nr:acetolactate synthase catalytic subunit [Tropicibacter sp. Alg240-R139]
MKKTTVADTLAAAMKRHGVEVVFGQSIPSAFVLALPQFGIQQIGYRTENAGGVMADGYARTSGKVGVVCAQNGPAATLLVAPMAEALKASVPMVAIVQDVPDNMVDKNSFQEFDHLALFHGCTKWARRVDRADRLDDYVDMAFTAATSGRPGPVALIVPMDVLRQEGVPNSSRKANLGSFPLDRMVADPTRVSEAANLLSDAHRPIIIAGGGVHLSGAHNELLDFAEKACIPVASTNMGKGAIAENHPLALGVFTSNLQSGNRAGELKDYLTDADVVLLIGTRTNQNGTDSWKTYPTGAKFIHIDIDPQEIGRNYEALRLVGDAKTTLSALTEAYTFAPKSDLKIIGERTKGAAEKVARYVKEVGAGSNGRLRPEFVMDQLATLIGPQDIVAADASYSSNWITTYLDAQRGGQRFLVPRGLAGLGWGMPMAMGAKIAHPDARVVALVGDGGFGHCWQELETARRIGLPLTVIVLNNSILGFQYHAENIHYGFHSNSVDFAEVDHAAIARACGCRGVRVSEAKEVLSALTDAFASDTATLIEVMTDPDAFPPISLFDGPSKERITNLQTVTT